MKISCNNDMLTIYQHRYRMYKSVENIHAFSYIPEFRSTEKTIKHIELKDEFIITPLCFKHFYSEMYSVFLYPLRDSCCFSLLYYMSVLSIYIYIEGGGCCAVS